MVEFGRVRWPGAYCWTLTVLLSMHPVPSWRSGGFNKLVPEEACVVGIPGGIPFCDCEVECRVYFPAQPVVYREFYRDFTGRLYTCTGKGVVICSRGHSFKLRNLVPVHKASHTSHSLSIVGLLSRFLVRLIPGDIPVRWPVPVDLIIQGTGNTELVSFTVSDAALISTSQVGWPSGTEPGAWTGWVAVPAPGASRGWVAVCIPSTASLVAWSRQGPEFTAVWLLVVAPGLN